MDFKTAILTCVKFKYADFSGRAIRSEYWFFVLFGVLAGAVAGVIDSIIGLSAGGVGLIGLIVSLGLMIPSMAAAARRLHDGNRSGWWLLLGLVPLAGLLVIYWLAIKGDDGENRFGPSPAAPVDPLAK